MKKWIVAVLMVGMLGWALYDFFISDTDASDEVEVTKELSEGAQEEVGLDLGNVAPDFTLTTLTGEEVSLSDYRGNRIMLNFWASWCPPCRAEMPDMEKFYQNTDIVILGVNLTAEETSITNVEDFVTEHSLTFPVLLDEDLIVASTYAIQPIPTTYMIDSSGEISNKFFGPLNYDMMIQEFEKMD